MTDFDEHSITDAVLARFAQTPDPRLRAILDSLVRHLHDFVRDVEPSFAEWMQAVAYLTRTGQTCTDKRQEFILLSDTLGVSMLVDAINHRMPAGATETTVLGPFYVGDPPERANGDRVSDTMRGEPLYVSGSVADADGRPLTGAVVDIWHSDKDGFYDVQLPLDAPAGRARFRTDGRGEFWFWTIQPTFYPIPADGPVGDMLAATKRHPYRPAHVHFMISAPGCTTLVTHVFEQGDRYLDSDAVFAVKRSLVREFTRHEPGTGPDGTHVETPWRQLTYAFRMAREGSHDAGEPVAIP